MRLTLAECQRRLHPQSEHQEALPQNQPHRGGQNRPAVFLETCWDWLDSVQLRQVFQHQLPLLKVVPMTSGAGSNKLQEKLWRPGLTSRERRTEEGRFEDGSYSVSCQCCPSTGQVADCPVSKPKLCRRLDLFAEGNWEVLRRDVVRVAGALMHTHTRVVERRCLTACRKVQTGEVTRTRQCLTDVALAPETDHALRELQSRRPETIQRVIPREVLEWESETSVQAKCS